MHNDLASHRRRCTYIGIGLVAIVSTFLTACTAAETPTPDILPTAPPTTDPSPLVTPTSESPSPLVVTLNLWLPLELDPYSESPQAALLSQRLSDFAQTYPDLQVRVTVKESTGRGGLLDFMRTASVAAPSVLPDLVVLNTSNLRLAAQQELIQPMDGLLPASLAGDRFPYALSLGDVGGQTMGVVIAAEFEHVAYRQSLMPTPPLTWSNVISAPTPFVFPAAGVSGDVNDFTVAQYLAAGGRLTDDDGNPHLDEAPLAAVLDLYQRGVAAGVISPTIVLAMGNASQSWESLLNWEAGMAVVNSRTFWSARDSTILFATLPAPDTASVTLARGWAIGLVTSDQERQYSAMLLLEYLLAPEHSGPWTQAGSYLPTTLSTLQEWMMSEAERTLLETVLESAVARPDPTVRSVVGPALQSAVEAVLEGRRSPAEAAASAAGAVNQ